MPTDQETAATMQTGQETPSQVAQAESQDNQQSEQQTQEKTYTQEELTRLTEKQTRKVENELLKMLGINSKDELQSIAEVFKEAQKAKIEGETPDKTIQRISDELAKAKDENAKIMTKLAAVEQREYLKSKSLDDADIPLYQAYISQLANENGVSFEEAAEDYLKTRPKKQEGQEKPPAAVMYDGAGGTALTNTLEDYKKMSPADKITFKQKNPSLYERFKKELGFN